MRGALAILTLLFASSLTSPSPLQSDTGLPLIYWKGGIETAAVLKSSGIRRVAVPPEAAGAWREAGFDVISVSEAEFLHRDKLVKPRITSRANVASATRRPWIDANGWRFIRNPSGRFFYDLSDGNVELAIAEAYAYGADVIVKTGPAGIVEAGKMIAFLRRLPQINLPVIADIGVIEDGSYQLGEVMNLLVRRNLLIKIVPRPVPEYTINIRLGMPAFPRSDAEDPSKFALMIRRALEDKNRSIRIFGTETVLCSLTGDKTRARLHLINYTGREANGLRVRVRGDYSSGVIRAQGVDNAELEEYTNDGNFTEFSISSMHTYAVIDLMARAK